MPIALQPNSNTKAPPIRVAQGPTTPNPPVQERSLVARTQHANMRTEPPQNILRGMEIAESTPTATATTWRIICTNHREETLQALMLIAQRQGQHRILQALISKTTEDRGRWHQRRIKAPQSRNARNNGITRIHWHTTPPRTPISSQRAAHSGVPFTD